MVLGFEQTGASIARLQTYQTAKLVWSVLLLNRKQLTTVFGGNYITGSDQQTNALNSGLVKRLKLTL